jgi:hypothetical protein
VDGRPERNLILVHSRDWQNVADFNLIKTYVDALAPDIETFVASNDIPSSATRQRAARRPTLIFSPITLLQFKPKRGKLYIGQPMSKIDEMRRLVAGGMPVPEFEVIEPGTCLSRDRYGPLVVLKPSHSHASWGQGIELWRTDRVRFRVPAEFPEWHPGRKAPMIAQRFIDSGYPMSCRVLTIFGEPILTYCRQSTKPLLLPPDKDFFEQHEYMPAPPHRTAFITRDADILALAAAAYRAMPEVALQACDIVREKATGRPYLLEINPGGGTWMFSSAASAGYREGLGISDLTAEFDSFRTIARVLADRTRAEAE